MIAPPPNDEACLGPTTEVVLAELAAGNPAIVDLAAQFTNTDDLAAWFRTLPQRDDDGDPADGPKVAACRPRQRLDFGNPAPNCFERAARWCGAAELIDPTRIYQLKTVNTPNGLHTYPLRDGLPVILDPQNVRNATPHPTPQEIATRRLRIQRLIGLDERKGLRFDLANARRAKDRGHTTWINGKPIDDAIATYEQAMTRYEMILRELDAQEEALRDHSDDDDGARNSTAIAPAAEEPIVLTPAQAVDWVAELARARATQLPGGERRIARGHLAMRGVLLLQPICVADARDVALVLALAMRAARDYGRTGLKIVCSTAQALDALDRLAAERATAPRNNPWPMLAINAIAGNKDLQKLLGSLVNIGGRVAVGAGTEVVKHKLGAAGVRPPILAALETELNREGLTLGGLAKPPPMAGSLDAMTPHALAGRWLAQKF